MADALPFVPSDIGNAERLVARHGGDFRYVPKWKSWMAWTGTHWERDETGRIQRACKDTLRQLAREAIDQDDKSRRDAMLKHALASEANGRINGMIERARAEPGMSIAHDVFDQRPFLLNVANGTVDLETGQLRLPERADYLTKRSPVPFDPDALCPRWEQFLLDVFDRRVDLIGYVQRAVGYSLTGDTSEQCLQLLHGAGANGKSTFLEVMQALCGDYGVQADFATFLDGRAAEGPRNDVARLAGARMVRTSEVGEGKRFNEALVKALTGSETISARFLYSEAFEFVPTFKLWFAANHKPVIRGQDHAIWRRVRLVPFDVQFDGARRDQRMKEKLLAELPGILAWAVAGALAWRRDGLQAPADVVAATEEYRRDSDVIGAFLEDCCDVGRGLEIEASVLYKAYRQWAKDGGEHELSQTAFGRRLEERGFGVRKSGVKYRVGLRLQSAPQPSQPSWLDR